MTLYHIKKDGTPGICHAQPGKCPLTSKHYTTLELAQKAIDTINKNNFINNSILSDSKINYLIEYSDAFFLKTEPSTKLIDTLTDFSYYRYASTQDHRNLDLAILKYQARNKLSKIVPYFKGWPSAMKNPQLGVNYTPIKLNINEDEEQFADSKSIRKYDKNNYKLAIADSNKFIKKLNKNEINLLSYWSSNGSTEIMHEKNLKKKAQLIKAINDAINKSDLRQAKILYRGIKSEELDNKKYVIGENIKFKNPKSTTKDSSIGLRFTDSDTIFEIKAKKAGSISIISSWGASEQEYIIPSDCNYLIKNIFKANYSLGTNNIKKVNVIQLEQN